MTEMQVDSQRIRSQRELRAWTQSHLAEVSGLGLRTVQRIEATGRASFESASAIAAAFSIPVAEMRLGESDNALRTRSALERTARLGVKRAVVPFAVVSIIGVTCLAFLLNPPAVEPPTANGVGIEFDEPAAHSQEPREVRDQDPRAPGEVIDTLEPIDTRGPTSDPGNSAERFALFVESVQSTPEEAESLLRENLNILAADPDRRSRFEMEATSQQPRLYQLENTVTNVFWKNVGDALPTNVESECYPQGCRLKLSFATNADLIAVSRGPLDLRMLFALQDYGFEAVDEALDFGDIDITRTRIADPRAIDMFLWPKGESRIRFEAAESPG